VQALQSLSAGQVNSPRKSSQQRAEAKKKTQISTVCLDKENAKRFAEQQRVQLESLAEVVDQSVEVEEQPPAAPTMLRLREVAPFQTVIPQTKQSTQDVQEDENGGDDLPAHQEEERGEDQEEQKDLNQEEVQEQKEEAQEQEDDDEEGKEGGEEEGREGGGEEVEEVGEADMFETAVAFKHMPTFRRKLHEFVSEKGNLVCELEKLKTELERLRGQKNSHELAMDYMCRRVIKFQQTLRVRELNLRTFFKHLSGSQNRLEESALSLRAAQQHVSGTSGTVGDSGPSFAQVAQWHQLCVGSCQTSLHHIQKVVSCSERVVHDAALVCSELYKLSTKQDITRGGKNANVGAELMQVAYCRDRALLKLEQKNGDVNKLEAVINHRNEQLEHMCTELGKLRTRLEEDGRAEGLLQLAEAMSNGSTNGSSNGSDGWVDGGDDPQAIVQGITVVIDHLQVTPPAPFLFLSHFPHFSPSRPPASFLPTSFRRDAPR
jgi:hypothetical protein